MPMKPPYVTRGRFPHFGRRTARLLLLAALVAAGPAGAQESARPVRVTVESEKLQVAEPVLPVDPQQHIFFQYGQNLNFGFVVDGNRITFSPNGATNNILARIDGRDFFFGGPPGRVIAQGAPLGAGPFGKRRLGSKSTWVMDNIYITQILEVIPSKPGPKAAPGSKRRLDTVLVHYEMENKDTRPHTVGLRTVLDMLIVNNDGALFASPTTHPKRILDGVDLRGKAVPEYLQVLQVPNLQNPGFVATFTYKVGSRLIGPDRVVLTGLRAGGGGWEIAAVPAMGDSAIAIYFSPKTAKPRGKLEFAYGYGQGIASNPEDEGKVSLALGGNFAPQRLFTVTAYVEAPVESQTLALELPPGTEAVEGPGVQPVPPPSAQGTSVVLWKARVLKTGTFPIRVRSSNGVTYTSTVTVSPAEATEAAAPARQE
jgi:hypothetical protein